MENSIGIVKTMNDDAFYQEVGRRLKEQRLAAGLTQEESALQCGIKRTTLAHIEKNHQRPSLHQFYLLCQGYGVEPQTILPANSQPDTGATLLNSKLNNVNIVAGSTLTPSLTHFLTMTHEESDEKS